MKHLLFAAAFCLLFASFASFAFAQGDEIHVIPKPQSVTNGSGVFVLNKNTRIVATNFEGKRVASVLNDLLQRNYGFKLTTTEKPQMTNFIQFDMVIVSDGTTEVQERYSLSISPNSIKISGEERGAFYAVQSLMQLLPINFTKEAQIRAVEIKDNARFGYRGMHLDVSRHFFPVEFVKKYIDLMSQYKFNTFHWHLTDDQGWRIEIKKYPKLTEIGSKRPESLVGRFSTDFKGDGVPVEGFYTQEQIKDVVAYAKARYITVIPEIELPGHSSAALAAYPELSCKADQKYKVQMTWGIFKEVYCPTEKTFSFLENVLAETIALFPDSPYVHIGGDEVLKDMWKDSPEVKALMEKENLKDEHEVQSYFVRRMEKFVNSKGKKIIGWDEILEGGLAPNATVMSWRGIKGGIEAAKAHHDVIMTPTDYAYLDYGQGDPATEPLNIGGYLPLEKVYSFDPVPKELSVDESKYILGGQGNIWTEYLPTPASVEYMAFPRMLAMAEDVWSTPENKDFADFSKRLSSQYARLDAQRVNYRIPEPIGLENRVLTSDVKGLMSLKSPVEGAKIYYTLDGSIPTEKSLLYTSPIILSLEASERKDLKTIVVLQNGRKSSVYSATLLRRAYLLAGELSDKRPGATFGFLIPSADASTEPTILSGETKSLSIQQFAKTTDLRQSFTVAFDGYINVPADGIYEFQTESTWDASIFIGGEKLIDTAGTKDRAFNAAVVPLRAGLHKISLRYNSRGGEPIFRIRWGIKGQGLRVIGGGDLMH